jgi:SAM-dependent methyltransferase
MANYTETFNARGDDYNAANRLCLRARETERSNLIAMLPLMAGDVICDAPAGGGYLAEGLIEASPSGVSVICVEPSPIFAKGIDPSFPSVVGRLDGLPLASMSVDHVASLAGLHHIVDKSPILAEMARIVRPGGRVAVADVQAGTPVADFLNDTVDRLTDTGHKGLFFSPGELAALMIDANLADVRERHLSFPWTFDGLATLIEYCRLLFGLVKADVGDVEVELRRYFTIDEQGGGTRLPWSLVYAVGTRPT